MADEPNLTDHPDENGDEIQIEPTTQEHLIQDADKWYEVTEIMIPGIPEIIYAYHEPGHVEEVSCFQIMIPDPDGSSILFDTGMGVAKITKVLKNPDKIKKIVLTHTHNDHSGGAKDIREASPDVEIHVHEKEAHILREGLTPVDKFEGDSLTYAAMIESEFDEAFGVTKEIRGFKIPAIVDYSMLKDNDVISFGSLNFRAIHTPGHTPGGICLWEESIGLLITGDMIYDGPIYLHLEKESDFEDYKASINKLYEIVKDKLTTILPGHNYPTGGPELLQMLWEFVNNVENYEGIHGEDAFGAFIEYHLGKHLEEDKSGRRLTVKRRREEQ